MPQKKGFWKFQTETEGSSLVKVEGNYAYLAAFSHGLIVLDISDHAKITMVSQFVPVLNFPDANPDASKINARGMVVENDVVYLCYDAGGIRIINVSDKSNPKETGRFSNPVMTGKPRAYNNVVLRDSLLYVGVDYCGVEILNVADTSNIRLTAWWNPWNCQTSPLNWFNSNGHVNEVVLDSQENKLFVSTGKSDVYVVDVSNPSQPDSCSIFGGIDNSIGTWGVNRFENKVGLAYICTVIPFNSNWSGVKVLTYNRTAHVDDRDKPRLNLYPNPANNSITVQAIPPYSNYSLYGVNGKKMIGGQLSSSNEISTVDLTNGIYFLLVNGYQPQKVVVLH